mmetsp:Transcript_3382/g.9671  ORF Transcript_3382/g.9671 Transcript_3382/m.9671 type:complete len:234 (-) Transcript_3382:60-761(-)
MMKPMKKPLLLAVLGAAAISNAQARRGVSSSLYAPRRRGGYNYHSRHRPSAIDLVSDMFSIPFYTANTNTLFRQHFDQLARLEQNSAPRYSISQSDDGKTIELAMELPGVPAKDLSIEVEEGKVLRIQGTRTLRENGSVIKSEFEQSFQLEDVDVENISVSLDSGILTITAPKKEPVVKRIPLQIKEEEQTSDLTIESKNEIDAEDNEPLDGAVGENDDFEITEDEPEADVLD